MTGPLPFATPQDWRAWLEAHHAMETELTLKLYKKASGILSITWEEAVIEALAFGWIDGVKRPGDDTYWLQRFTPRKPRSGWSQKNRAHAEKLIAEGRMAPAGLAQVHAAKADGRWEAAYAGGKDAQVPQDFLDALTPAAAATYQTLNAQNRFAIYYRLTSAKRPETRAKRMADFVAMLERGERLYP
ncbi:MAG: YdeI/OmpD-associated family protein [Tabrizicola sp.]